MVGFLTAVGVIIVVSLVYVYYTFTWGYTLYSFYNWFLLPVFKFLPEITWYQACGVFLFITLFNVKQIKLKEEDAEPNYQQNFLNLLQPLMVWLLGYLMYHIFLK